MWICIFKWMSTTKRTKDTISALCFSFQLTKDDGLPTNICHRCLYNTEQFAQFRAGVHQCERKLHDFVQSLASDTSEITARSEWCLDDILNDQHESSEFYQNDVVVIDPLQCCDSSDEELDDDIRDDRELADLAAYNEMRQHLSVATTTMSALPHPLAMPSNMNFGAFKQSANKMNYEDARPLRNVCFCKYCEAPFAQRSDCDAHENSHDRLMPYACNFCPFRCDNPTGFIDHIRKFHDPERPFYCSVPRCDKHFGRRADLRKHGVSHTSIRPFGCPICKKSFSRKTNVVSHMKVHEGNRSHAQPMDLLSPQKSQSPTKKLLHHHQQPLQQQPPRIAYGLPPAAAVGYPSTSMPMQMQMQMPMQMGFQTAYQSYANEIHQSAFPAQQQDVVYSKCAVKSEPNKIPKLKIKMKFKKPAKVAGAVKKFDCLTCKKSFKTKRDLDRHSQIHNGMKFQCSVCQKGFTRRDKMVRHEKTHANRSKTAALPESAFLPENLKRSHFSTEHRTSSFAAGQQIYEQQQQQQQAFQANMFRPQFYAEYDLTETNN